MDIIKRLSNMYPSLKFEFIKMPEGLPGYNNDNEIFIDSRVSKKTQNELLAEEVAHYATTVGNIVNKNDSISRKQELQARRTAVTYLVTLDDLIECYEDGDTKLFELADHLNINEDKILNAIDYYRNKLGLNFKYKDYYFDLTNTININKIKKN
ncbi:ImmA/IrrE family metallo-endopeptidase [Companilactobacillus sp. DQM5]|uniref:ImmA/IrrE family metallo-endopeptidase n=1 Tax=Companilactobacillus sp. DQM5 TaxID=3463359 RepID=UPI004059C512